MRRIKKFIKTLVGICILVLFIYIFKFQGDFIKTDIGGEVKNIVNRAKGTIKGNEKINSHSALLVDLDTGKYLYDKKRNEKIYPASLTKIMTTLVALENIDSLDSKVTISGEDFRGVYEEGLATAGFREGEVVTNRDLLYGIMLPSGAEAANAITKNLGGNEHFVNLMNEKARELGMGNTNFTNVTGVHDEEHYTTVNDLSLLLRYALKDGNFKAIFTKKAYRTELTGLYMDSRVFSNLEEDKLKLGSIQGGKTGYTDKAGLCLATLYERDGKEYILITTGAKGGPDTVQYNFMDAYNIYNNYL